ncbi:Ppx/GppA phosphatase family protein [Streptomyces sp. NPDC059582]|uniref:Ppx/GppA phosphatase family protein n=1 Tax=Streptomyces sp. NPDC059582 TaxID=3346875 RepID=UPI0036D060E8
MRQAGVLDVGCHSALLTVARGRTGAQLDPVFSRKVRLSLHKCLEPDGRLTELGMRSVQRAVAETLAEDLSLPRSEVFAFATSVIRDAPNRDEVVARVARATGVRLQMLSGEEEARLAYVAARKWSGPTVRPLLVLDIGGGTVEIAHGSGHEPHTVLSLPLGARTVTRSWLPGGVVTSKRHLAKVRHRLRESLSTVPDLPRADPGERVLASSRTFAQLARLATDPGAPRHAPRSLTLPELQAAIRLLAATSPARRGDLPGISRHRAEQSLAGALVAEALLETCEADSVVTCPWSTREGLLLERLATASRRPDGTTRQGAALAG